MKKIGLIGGGNHSRHNHLPALQRYREVNPGVIELAAFCDLNETVAQKTAEEYGFTRHYTNVAEMLAAESLDGVIAVTPIAVTKAVAEQVIASGVPLVIEKPPGRNLAEARAICDFVTEHQARVMVSVNRRFDPALVAAKQWLASRTVAYFRASMPRNQRREPTFFSETGIHAFDAMRWFCGDIARYQARTQWVDGVAWHFVDLEFESGVRGLLEVMPTCGIRDERYEFYGADFRAVATNGEMSTGEFLAWERGEAHVNSEPAQGQPGFIRNGTMAETEEFIASLVENRPPTPTPADILPSVQTCLEIERAENGNR